MDREKLLRTRIQPVDIEKTDGIGDLLEAYRRGSFQARSLGDCVEVFRTMLTVPKAVIFFGLSGAMVPAGMRKLISTMIRRKMIDVVVSTGANLYHDYYEALGHHHYKGNPRADDAALEKMDIDRVYDTYMDDRAAVLIDHKISSFVEELPPGRYSTRAFFAALAKTIDDPDSIIRSCHEAGVPLFCPTYHDSGFGIGVTHYYLKRREESRDGFILDLIRDNYEVLQIGQKADESGAFLIGGGVPKNYIQQIAPMQEVLRLPKCPYRYAVQITTDDPKWGGLSGCTFSESHSWGKYVEGARTAVAYVDATIGLPLVVGAVLQTAGDILSARGPRRFTWDGDRLTSLTFDGGV